MTTKKQERRIKIKYRVRKNVNGTAERPRLSVFRSNKQIYAQVINDVTGTTLASASSLGLEAMPKTEQAQKVGALLAEKAKAAGMEKVTLVPVYNDILTCFQNTVSRGKSTWRYTAIDYLVSSFRGNIGKLEQISQAFPDLEILPVDCSHNQGAVRVMMEDAWKWNYDISDEEMKQVLSYLLAEINSGEIEAGSVPAVVGDIRSITNISESNAALVDEIDQKTQAIIREYKLR